MSLDTKSSALWEEVRAAEKFRDEHLKSIRQRVARYHGPGYKGVEIDGVNNTDPENHAFEWISSVVPRMAYDNPKFNFVSKRPGNAGIVVDALRRGCNRWARDVNFKRDCEVLAVDYAFAWFAAIVTLEARPGMHQDEDPVMWPQVYRLGFKEFFLDPRAKQPEDSRYMGHTFIRDHQDLIDEARDNKDLGWDLEAIEKLKPGEGVEEFHQGGDEYVGEKAAPDRKEVLLKEVWVGSHELDDSPGSEAGFHGTIFTLSTGFGDGDGNKPKYIRKPRPYYGPRSGPYVLAGSYTIPDDPWPMSALAAVESQAKDMNDHARASKNSADSYKRMVFVDNSMDRDLAEKVKNTPDSFVVPVNGLDKNSIVPVEIGGLGKTQMDYLMVAKDRLERNSGMHESRSGATSGATATEVAVADRSSETRMGFVGGKFEDGIKQIARKIAFYLFIDDEIIFPLGSDDAEEMRMQNPWFRGGGGLESGFTFDDLEIDIEPYSMSRISEATLQQRTMQVSEIVMQMGPMVPQMPWIRWKNVLKQLGESIHSTELEDLIDVDMAMELAKAQPQPSPWDLVAMTGRQAGRNSQKAQDSRVKESGAYPRAIQGPTGMGNPGMGGGGPVPTEGGPLGGAGMAMRGDMDRR
jgi:hypothetical protein